MSDVNSTDKGVQNTLRNAMDAFSSHSFFVDLKSTELTNERLQGFATQYWHLTQGFPALLGMAIAQLKTDRSRWPVVKNLWDEHGGDQSELGHRLMYRDFLAAVADELDATDVDLTQTEMNVHTTVYLAGMKQLIMSSSESCIAGLLAFCEAVAPFQCSAISVALERKNPATFSKNGVGSRFWVDHAEHDPAHIREILSICDSIKEFDHSQFSIGVEAAHVLERLFWDGIAFNPSCQTN